MRVMHVLAVLGIAVMMSGCAGQSAVSNQTNNFSYAGQTANANDSETYTWKNTIGNAQVDWGGQAASGKLTLTIKDAVGKQVFSRSLGGTSQEGFSGPTSAGAPGDWTIRISFDDFTGQMGLAIRAGASGSGGSWGQGWG